MEREILRLILCKKWEKGGNNIRKDASRESRGKEEQAGGSKTPKGQERATTTAMSTLDWGDIGKATEKGGEDRKGEKETGRKKFPRVL